MSVSYLDVGGIKSLEPYMAAFANALGQRLSPSGRLDTAFHKDPTKYVDTINQKWGEGTPKSIIKEYGDVIFNPEDPEKFYFTKAKSIPAWGKAVDIDPASRAMPPMGWEAMAELPAPPPFGPRMPPQLDAGTSGNSIFDLMNTEQAMNDGQHYPAILHKDEEVINPMASEAFRPILQQMNQAVPSNSAAMPPIMDVGGRIEEQRLLQQRGSPWAPAQPLTTPPPNLHGAERDFRQLPPQGKAPTGWPYKMAPETFHGDTRDFRQVPTLDPKKKEKVEEAASLIGEVLESIQKDEAKKAEKEKAAPGKGKVIPPRKPEEPLRRPGWNMRGQPMNIDWEYIQSLPTMQAQAVLQQYTNAQQMPMLSLQQMRAGADPMSQRMELMQGLMGQYRGGAEMPGVKGEAATKAAQGASAVDKIKADIGYTKALTRQADFRLAVVQEADPNKAGKLSQLEITNQQNVVKIAGDRAKLLEGAAVKDYHREYIKLVLMMDPTVTEEVIMTGLDSLKMKGWWTKKPAQRQDETLSLDEVRDIIKEFLLPPVPKAGKEGGGTTFEDQKKSMGG